MIAIIVALTLVPHARTAAVHASPAATTTSAGSGRFCDHAPNGCVYDIGFHDGEDTDLYLEQRYAVVAVEANPILVGLGAARFFGALVSDELRLLSVGIDDAHVETLNIPMTRGKHTTVNTLSFYVNNVNSVWSSLDRALGCRTKAVTGKNNENVDDAACQKVDVPTVTCAALIRALGRPIYMKIDVEGRDAACVESLKQVDMSDRPPYVSVENLYMLDLLHDLGYDAFKAVDQRAVQSGFYTGRRRKNRGGSGPWGDAAVDVLNGTRWKSYNEMAEQVPALIADLKLRPTWYDMHARRSDSGFTHIVHCSQEPCAH